MAWSAAAFAPGHVTGFFEAAQESDDPAQVGSRGAGFSLTLGVRSRVRIDDQGVPGVTVLEQGRPSNASTTRRAVELLSGERPLHVLVEQESRLPVSHGFGTSAAGALSASLAVAEILGRTRTEAVWAAHVAEVFERTGLGDVVGAAQGGFEVRVRPGLPPAGEVRAWRPEAPTGEVLLAVVDEAIETRRILSDAGRRKEINRVGKAMVDGFLEDPGLGSFVDASRTFAFQTGLASRRIREVLEQLGPDVPASQCMLGGSLFVFGANASIRRTLEGFGAVQAAAVDPQGARVVEPRTVLA